MSYRHRAGIISGLRTTRWTLLASCAALLFVTQVAQAAAPAFVSAVSRKLHAGVPYDVPITTDGTAIECRVASSGVTVVFTFDVPVNAGTATVKVGTGSTSNATVAFSGNQMTVTMPSLIDNGTVTVTANNVAAADGSGTLATQAVVFHTSLGDINANGSISASDVNAIKAAIGQPVSGFNFRCDLNSNGSITASDVNLLKTKVGQPGTGTPATNTAPTIGALSTPQPATSGQTSTPVGFAVGDAESDPAALAVAATSDNQTLLPDNNIFLGGSGASRTISVAPAAGQIGTCNVTVTVGDGLLTNSTTFAVNVTAASTLYLAQLAPENGAVSTASGSATLQVSGDQTYAILRFQYGNLSSTKVAEHLHNAPPGVDGPIIFDIDMPGAAGFQQADGSYRWNFPTDPNASPNTAQILNMISSGNMYMNVHTVNYPNGEIRGQFALANGSQTFTPPGPPPALPPGPPTSADAGRFLTQATFGATTPDVQSLVNGSSTALNDWITKQMDPTQTPITSVYQTFYNRVTKAQAPNAYADSYNYTGPDTGMNCVYNAFLTGPDQLRQRVAFAYSQLFVISGVDDNISGHSAGMMSWHDTLANDAFANFRTIMNDVTLHPVMGQYLNMRGNVKPTSPNFTAPNENYAREILQLFSIGLNVLQPDGTLKLDANGLPIPTYDQSDITNFAAVFTGWNTSVTTTIPTLPQPSTGNPVVVNVGDSYVWFGSNPTAAQASIGGPMTVNASLHATTAKNLLNNFTIPANSSQTTASANQELNQALDNIFQHPNVGPFVCKQLIQRLVCSNPSPAYVYRVAQVFANNGSGVRGDMGAVIRAILTDYEARAPITDAKPLEKNPGYGKLREPVLRLTSIVRAFHPVSAAATRGDDGPFRIGNTDTSLGQAPYRAPSVFNFYVPTYVDPGAIAKAGLVAPELQIVTENTSINLHNTLYAGINNSGSPWPGGDIALNYTVADPGSTSEVDLCDTTKFPVTNNPTGGDGLSQLLDRINVLFYGGQMDTNTRTTIYNYVKGMNAGGTGANATARAKALIYLSLDIPQANVQK